MIQSNGWGPSQPTNKTIIEVIQERACSLKEKGSRGSSLLSICWWNMRDITGTLKESRQNNIGRLLWVVLRKPKSLQGSRIKYWRRDGSNKLKWRKGLPYTVSIVFRLLLLRMSLHDISAIVFRIIITAWTCLDWPRDLPTASFGRHALLTR